MSNDVCLSLDDVVIERRSEVVLSLLFNIGGALAGEMPVQGVAVIAGSFGAVGLEVRVALDLKLEEAGVVLELGVRVSLNTTKVEIAALSRDDVGSGESVSLRVPLGIPGVAELLGGGGLSLLCASDVLVKTERGHWVVDRPGFHLTVGGQVRRVLVGSADDRVTLKLDKALVCIAIGAGREVRV